MGVNVFCSPASSARQSSTTCHVCCIEKLEEECCINAFLHAGGV